jgi:hypothetical protein
MKLASIRNVITPNNSTRDAEKPNRKLFSVLSRIDAVNDKQYIPMIPEEKNKYFIEICGLSIY